MIFKEIKLPDGNVKYQMGQNKDTLKDVSKETYDKLMEDDKFKSSDNITMPKLNMSETEQVSDCGDGDGEFCEECQEILDLIFDLSEMDDQEAIDMFKHIIFINKREGFLEGLIEAYGNISNLSAKISARFENQLDDLSGD